MTQVVTNIDPASKQDILLPGIAIVSEEPIIPDATDPNALIATTIVYDLQKPDILQDKDEEDKTILGTFEKGFKSVKDALFGESRKKNTKEETKMVIPSTTEAGETETKIVRLEGTVNEDRT